MAKAQITKGIWHRQIHDTWENKSGYRTDIPLSVLDGPEAKVALFVLDDGRGIFIKIDELRRALQDAPIREDKKIKGPFNVNPHASTVNGSKVEMRIELADT
jgi:hypothetical protein